MVKKLFVIVVLVFILVGLADGQTPRSAKKPATPRPPATNVILITIDTVRADHLGYAGYKNIQTPTLDGLAHDGVVFDRAISQVPQTWPSHAAILTGTYPFQNGVQDFTGQPLQARFQSAAQAFKRKGYATGAVVSGFVLDRSWGLNRGFDFYDDAFSAEQFKNRDLGLVDRKAEESVSHALNWLNKNPKRPFFFWLHLYDPHSAYDPPEPFHTKYQDHLYDGEIAYADHELGRLIEWLKRNGLYDRALIVMLSDHGESLGDHGETEHGFFIYNSTVNIPLIVKPPTGTGIVSGHVSRPVETVAVAPTLLTLSGISDPIEKQFASPGLFGSEAEKKDWAYSETFYPFSSYGWSPLHSMETARYHYIDAPHPELYDLSSDASETNNIASQQAATVSVLKDKLQQLLRTRPFTPDKNESAGVSPDALDKLRALGYVAYRSPVSYEKLASGLADPKDKLEEFNLILKATDAFHSNDVAGGQAIMEKVREKDPTMYIVPFLLGEALSGQMKWDEASAEFKTCLNLNPNFDQAMTGLARALMFSGHPDEAKTWARKALEYNPQNYRAWYELGFIDAKSDRKSAIANYEKAVAIQGNFAPLRRDLGMLQFQEQNFAEAATQLAKAVELGMNEAQLYNFLGICYSRRNRVAKAIAAYKEGLKLDPDRAEIHLNMGFAYEKLAKKQLAALEYKEACRLSTDVCRMVPGGSR